MINMIPVDVSINFSLAALYQFTPIFVKYA